MQRGRDTVSAFTKETRAMLWSDQGGVTEDPYAWCMERVAEDAIPKRLRMNRGQFQMIDWPLHGKVLSSVEPGYRPSIQKMIWQENPCMMKLRRNGKREDAACPLCGKEDEPGHFSVCSGVRGQQAFERLLGNLRAKLRKRNTSPVLAV